jgi:serine/threonine-protein kinase
MNDSFKLDPGAWSALRRLLDQALDLPATDRAAWLESLGPDDAPFRHRLRALLAHADDGPAKVTVARLLDTLPQVETAQFAPAPHDGALKAGSTVGPYRLLRLLGEGGMGEVWLAERTDLLQQRQVALKLPRLVTGRARLAERLAREREILATLEHPNIARLYDAGVSADGQPYLALEYVEGERIDAWCARKALDVSARLRLFLQVARAVAHAHARLVVHRDLKPANILVTEAGEVRLLDFGIAKLLEDGRAQETELTQLAGRALTPDYAAPEQILGQPIGTAADVYALGVVLFELLTGHRPYRLKRDSRAALEEAIAQAEVQRPSSVVAEARLRRRLRGDLDTIVLKALKRAPAERYGTVEALADDLQRWLEQRPVLAQPDRALYRFTRFVARHRVGVVVAGAVASAVLSAAGAALWQARAAEAERARAEQVKNFIADLLRQANPAFQGGRKVTVDQLLLATPARIDSQFANRPDVRAELLAIVATSLASIGEEKAALPLLEAAGRDAEQHLGPTHVLTLHVRSILVSQRLLTQPGPEVVAEADRLLAAMRREPGVDPAYLANLLGERSQMAAQAGEHAESIRFAREALAVASERIGEGAEQTMNTAVALAYALQRSGDWQQALEAARRVERLVFEVRKLPDDHFNAVDARLMLGMALADAGQLEQGLAQLESGLRHSLVRRQPTDSTIGSFRTLVAGFQMRAGRLEAAADNLAQAVQVQRDALGAKSRRYAAASAELGRLHLVRRDPARAIAPLAEAHAYLGGGADVLAPPVAARLAVALAASGRMAEGNALMAAVASSTSAWSAASTSGPASGAVSGAAARASWEVLHRQGQLARLAGRAADALAAQQAALALLPDAPSQQVVRAELLVERAAGELALGRAAEALASAEQAVALLRQAQLQPTPAWADARQLAAQALSVLKRPGEASARLDEAAAIWRQLDPSHPSARGVERERALQRR